MSPDIATKLAAANVTMLFIPRSCTHVFQPADSFVIAAFKKYVAVAWDSRLQSCFARLDVADAVEATTKMTAAARRLMLYECMAEGLANVKPNTLEASWAKSGAMRAMFGEVPLHSPYYDQYVVEAQAADAAVVAIDDDGDNAMHSGDDDHGEDDVQSAHGEDDDDHQDPKPDWYKFPLVLQKVRGRPRLDSRGVCAVQRKAGHAAMMKRKRDAAPGIMAFARKGKKARLMGTD
eukprot:TRINITY_DN9645_c0_g1_i7.p4 TRINITY_DN9645_c0_g1~~TRINITY_DN9645_c0_g1_i7.p4  ORF type:complete len:234 (-),score=81.19 TRINITY_DN9645_c0_g1_i7:516-1217(-)